MNQFIKSSFLIVSLISLVACSNVLVPSKNASKEVSSSENNSSIKSSSFDSSSDTSSNAFSSSSQNSDAYSYDFPKKEEGLTLEQITEEVNKYDSEERVKVRYTYHTEEKLTGTYPMTMDDGSQMAEGVYSLDLVTEPRTHNLDTNIKVISGTPFTKNQRFLTSYTSSVTPSGWLGYHAQRRQFLNSAQEGEGFEERFYTGPLTLWMMDWGVRPANARIDGTYFSFTEFERIYNEAGYCISFKMKEFYHIKGTLSGFMIGEHYYDGTYEWNTTCTIEYLEE